MNAMSTTNTMNDTSTILIVGCGRLGSRTAMLLAESLAKENNDQIKEDKNEYNNLILCDYDTVMQDNLHEQPIYTANDIGTLKVEALAKKLKEKNQTIKIKTIPKQFSEDILRENKIDRTYKISIIIDGTDNLETRAQLNRAALQHHIPLIIAAATESRAMIFPVSTNDEDSCWECIAAGKQSDADCSSGIDNSLADTITKTQTELCLQILRHEQVLSKLLIIEKNPDNNNYTTTKKIVVRKNPTCICITKKYSQEQFTFKPCLTGRRLIARTTSTAPIDFERIKKHYLIQKEYSSAILVDLKIGTALVHKYGAIEFNSIPEDIARKFAEDIMK